MPPREGKLKERKRGEERKQGETSYGFLPMRRRWNKGEKHNGLLAPVPLPLRPEKGKGRSRRDKEKRRRGWTTPGSLLPAVCRENERDR